MRVRRLCSPQLLLFLSFLLATLVIATPASVKNQLEKAAETPDEKYIDLGAADELDKARKTTTPKLKTVQKRFLVKNLRRIQRMHQQDPKMKILQKMPSLEKCRRI